MTVNPKKKTDDDDGTRNLASEGADSAVGSLARMGANPRVIRVDRPFRRRLAAEERRLQRQKQQPPLTEAALQLRLRELRLQWHRAHARALAAGGGALPRPPSSRDALASEREDPRFASNVVISAKYSLLNFTPRVLAAQLRRPSNVYFLLIAVLQTIKEVSNTSGIPTILLPLGVVVVCSAIKEALEDRERHRADRIANSRKALTLGVDGEWEYKQWGELQVGDVVKVLNNQTVPADMFMLSAEQLTHDNDDNELKQLVGKGSADPSSGDDALSPDRSPKSEGSSTSAGEDGHVAYVETKSLDGETNLKIRTAIPVVALECSNLDGLNRLQSMMECEPPNSRIASFDGSFSLLLDDDDNDDEGEQQLPGAVQVDRIDIGAQPQTSEQQDSPTSHSSTFDVHDPLLSSSPRSPGLSPNSLLIKGHRRRVSVPVTAKQMILRSCVLRNTNSITGLVVFTGHETKVFCSNTDPVVKTSSVEQRLNVLIVAIVLIQQLVCLLGAMLGAYWMVSQGNGHWYLNVPHPSKPAFMTYSNPHPIHELLKLHVRYFIIMQNFVPISLNVSLEFVKYWQAYFIEQDLEMYDEATDTPAIVRSSALNEDLGRVHHVFTDKTGTLTMNLMLFRYCMINGKHYGGEIDEGGIEGDSKARDLDGATSYVDFDPSELFNDLQRVGEQADSIRLFLRHLALCHTLIPTKSLVEMCSTNLPEYSASSPDEQALVSAAAHCNVRFVHRTPDALAILESGEKIPSVYRLHHVLEFDSDRKRMTVIVETPSGEILLLCKGADSVILERLADHQGKSNEFLDSVYSQLSEYAKCGMRTLCMAYKKIPREDFDRWSAQFSAAQASIDELAKKRQGAVNDIDTLMNDVERDLELVGATAVQDKLQAGVPNTLKLLQESNIKIWTLTGDKMETAINIGYASSLLSNDMELHQVASADYSSTEQLISKALQESDDTIRRKKELDEANGVQGRSMRSYSQASIGSSRHGSNNGSSWSGLLYGTDESKTVGGPQRQQYRRRRQSRGSSQRFGDSTLYSSVSLESVIDEVLSDEDEDDVDESRAQRSGFLDNYRNSSGKSVLAASFAASQAKPTTLALVIDGKALEFALRPQLRDRFYELTKRCVSVICCRVSPKQKADIVEFIRRKEKKSITLAIGDGANDVGMIQAAHIGVGISGLEGTQAVNASDYAIAQFRFLQRLLFVHGRWAYRRVTKLMSYMLYKNVTYVLTTFWFGCYCGFSGQPLILDVAAQSFNVLYTSIPLVLFAVFDQDISSESAAKFPHLYALGQNDKLLQRRVFWPWILNGIWHSLVIFFISTWAFDGIVFSSMGASPPTVDSDSGKDHGLVTLGFVVFSNLVVVVNLKLCLEAFLLTWQFLATVAISILLWFGVAELISLPGSGITQATGEMTYLDGLPSFWMICFLVISLSILRDSLWKTIRRLMMPSSYHILQEREVLDMPNSPRRIRAEQRGRAFSDISATVVDYGKLFRHMPSPRESSLRSSPLGERLMPTQEIASGDSGRERNIRARWSFHAPGSAGSWNELGEDVSAVASIAIDMPQVREEESGVAAVPLPPTLARVDSDTLRRQYHGYAFSEDEYIDDNDDLSSTKTVSPGRGFDKRKKSFGFRGSSSSFGTPSSLTSYAVPNPRSIKKMIKSVRGTKNA